MEFLEDSAKLEWLIQHLRRPEGPVLVFSRTKVGADRLAQRLHGAGIKCAALHADRTQDQRRIAVEGFKGGRYKVLVATDIAARGLDIEELPHVVNYELPNVPEDYVHRIGRTGRAGNNGEAISLVSSDENAYLADIERLIKRRVEREVIAGFEPGTAASAAPPAAPRRAQAQPSGRSSQPQGKPRTQAPKPARKPDPAIATAGAGKAPVRSAPPAPRRDNRRQTPVLLGNQSRRAN